MLPSPTRRPHQGGHPQPLDWPDDRTFAPLPPSTKERREWQVNPDDLFIAILLGAVFVATWPAVLALRLPQPLQLPVVVAHVTGMLAGYGVLVLLALMSRAPALERGVGADVLARWHGRGGRLVITLILVHAWAAVVAWAHSRREGTLLASWHVLRLPQLMAATVGTLLLLAVAVGSIRAARQRLSYEKWHGLHLLTYVGIALSFLHQLAGPDLGGHRVLQISWALLYTHVFALLLRHRVLTPLRQAMRHRLRVAAVVPEGPGVVSIEVEGQHVQELQAEPGQFFRWRFLTPNSWLTAHPFSLSAPPTDHGLRLTVKSLGQGSAHLQAVAAGTWVVARRPVRSHDRRPANAPSRAAHRRRRRHHSDARAVRVDPAGLRPGPHPALPRPKPRARAVPGRARPDRPRPRCTGALPARRRRRLPVRIHAAAPGPRSPAARCLPMRATRHG
jgi:DMSO/TMAO reductase YedYZ heme-binding membrane subunit